MVLEGISHATKGETNTKLTTNIFNGAHVREPAKCFGSHGKRFTGQHNQSGFASERQTL